MIMLHPFKFSMRPGRSLCQHQHSAAPCHAGQAYCFLQGCSRHPGLRRLLEQPAHNISTTVHALLSALCCMAVHRVALASKHPAALATPRHATTRFHHPAQPHRRVQRHPFKSTSIPSTSFLAVGCCCQTSQASCAPSIPSSTLHKEDHAVPVTKVGGSLSAVDSVG